MAKVLGICLLCLILPLQGFATTAKIYVWRNEQGVLVFSDTPKPGAEEVKVTEQNNVMPSMDTSILDIKPQVIEDKYQINVSQPKQNETIRDNTGSVYIAGLVKPIFKQGFRVQLFLDAKPYKKPQSRAMYILRNIDRGEHTVKFQLINDQGKVIASSDPVTFYMHRASVN